MPSTATDRLQGLTTSVAVKAPCKAVSTTALTLSGEQTVGGVACVSGDRVLYALAGGSVSNGIWVVSTGAWTRATDFDGARDVVTGTLILVRPGTGDARLYSVNTTGDIVPGVTSLTIDQASLDGTTLGIELADTASAANGDALVGVKRTETGGTARTQHSKNLDVLHAADFGVVADGVTDCADALENAINAASASGAYTVDLILPAGTISVGSSVILKSNVRIRGAGIGRTIIAPTLHSFSVFTDNNSAVDNVSIEDLSIVGPSAPSGTTNRGIFFDADSTTNRLTVKNVYFKWLFRGINAHQVGTFEYDNIEGESLLDSTIYIGEVAANRSGTVKMGRSSSVNSFTDSPAGGGGVIVIAYVDNFSPGWSYFSSCGPSSGSVNLYHGLYLRTCGSGDAGYIKATGHKRGAPLHIYADNGAGEPNCGDTTATVVSDGAANYVGVRVDRCDQFTLRSGSKISASALQAGYFTNSGPITIEAGVRALNNNGDAVTSAVGSAAWRVSTCSDFTAQGVVMIDDTTTAAAYGQGCGFAFEGTCPRYTVDSCQMVYPTSATGYYFISHESGSTVTYPQITNNYTSGPQTFLNEGGTVVPAGQGVMKGNTRDSATVSPLMTVAQLHRWRVTDNWNEGARFIYESDGTNVWFWGSDNPASQTWVAGDRWIRAAPAAGGVPGGRCVTGGTPGTWKYEAAIAA